MKCPLLMLAQRAHDGSHTIPIADCVKADCAWWVETQATCAIKQLALSLGFISLDTTQLLERMFPVKK